MIFFNGELKLYDVFKNAREMACLYHEDDNNIYEICENIEKLFEILQNKLNTMNVRNGAKTIERRKERFRCIYFNMIATYLMIANRFTNSQIDAIRKIIRSFSLLIFNKEVPQSISLSHSTINNRKRTIDLLKSNRIKELMKDSYCYSISSDETEENHKKKNWFIQSYCP